MKIKINKDRYFKRSIDEELAKWSSRRGSKTIALINGARRTGKTHSLAFLGEERFKNYEIIEVDKLSDEEVASFVNKAKRMDFFCDYLLRNCKINKENISGDLLIVFDEIQEHNELKETISFLNEKLACRFACTGSALWINDTNGTRPTPDYEPFKIYPFSFMQFLEIVGEDKNLLEKERNVLTTKKDRDGSKDFLRLLRLYIALGGMPQIIDCYLDNRDNDDLFCEIHRQKTISIVNTYENDLRRYGKLYSLKLLDEYRNILRNIGIPKNIADNKEIYQKLEQMNIVILSKKLNDIQTKLTSSIDDLFVKPFLLDVGILFYYLCESDNREIINTFYNDFVNGKDSDNNGYLYENYVASSLIQKCLPPFFKTFTDINDKEEEENYELDFVFSNKLGPIVLEAKSGGNKEHKSLEKALHKYQKIKYSYVLCKSYKFDKKNIQRGPHYIPFYALDFLMR